MRRLMERNFPKSTLAPLPLFPASCTRPRLLMENLYSSRSSFPAAALAAAVLLYSTSVRPGPGHLHAPPDALVLDDPIPGPGGAGGRYSIHFPDPFVRLLVFTGPPLPTRFFRAFCDALHVL
jgi:hypothetical protein